MIRTILCFVLAAILLMGMTACAPWLDTPGESTEAPATEAVPLAPDFSVMNGEGEYVTLSQQIGKPVIVNLWASWCPPCKAEMPHFEQAYQDHPDVVFMMINLTVSDSREDADSFIAQSGYTFPVYYDTTGQAAIAYNVSSIPMTLFVDASGKLVSHKVGMLTEQELTESIARIAP